MRKMIFFALIFFIVSLASADTLRLKNGTTVNGTVVKQTEEEIKIDTGIGINTTYYPEEIESIEITKGQSKTLQVPEDGPSETYLKLQQAIQSGDFAEIKKYITEEKAKKIEDSGKIAEALKTLQGIAPKDLKIIKEDILGDQALLTVEGTVWGSASTGTVNLLNKGHNWVVENEDWKMALKSPAKKVQPTTPNTDKGSIEGIVRLPETDKKGDLFISFTPAGQMLQGPDTPQLFVVVPEEEISSQEIPFSLKDLPAGDYWGFATWDLAEPFWEASWGEGNCPGYPGDYVGGTKETVTVAPGKVSRTEIDCTRNL